LACGPAATAEFGFAAARVVAAAILRVALRRNHLAVVGSGSSITGNVLADPEPTPNLLSFQEYAAAMKAMQGASLPDKGERPDRDPQVC
jgi:hypothetical protein